MQSAIYVCLTHIWYFLLLCKVNYVSGEGNTIANFAGRKPASDAMFVSSTGRRKLGMPHAEPLQSHVYSNLLPNAKRNKLCGQQDKTVWSVAHVLIRAPLLPIVEKRKLDWIVVMTLNQTGNHSRLSKPWHGHVLPSARCRQF